MVVFIHVRSLCIAKTFIWKAWDFMGNSSLVKSELPAEWIRIRNYLFILVDCLDLSPHGENMWESPIKPLSNPQSAQCHLVRTASFRGRWTCVICIERLSRELPAKPHLAEWVGTCKVGLCWPVFGLIMCCCRCLKSGKPPGTLWFRKSRNG